MSGDFRVIVTGSRDWADSYAVASDIYEAARWAKGLGHDRLVVVHGACPTGADKAAADCAVPDFAGVNGIPVIEEPHPANWAKYHKRAGFIRNQEMVDAGAHFWLAFLAECLKPDCLDQEPHGSHGTVDCITRAVKARIPGRTYV